MGAGLTAARAWHRFWFRPVPVRRLAVFRLIITGFTLVDVVWFSSDLLRSASADREFYRPITLLRILGLSRRTPVGTESVRIVLVVALACAFLGVATRLALGVAAALYVWWLADFYSYGAIHHTHVPIALALVALTVAPSGGAYSLDVIIARMRRVRAGHSRPTAGAVEDPLAGWALRFVQVAIVLAYLLAAYAKLRVSGLAWVRAGSLEAVIVDKGTPPAVWLLHHTWLLQVMAAVTLLLESTAWIALLGRRFRDVWLGGLASFHVGSLVLLRINFVPWLFAYPAFYELEALAQWFGERARGVADAMFEPIVVRIDGQCRLCLRVAVLLDGLDWFGRLRIVETDSVDVFSVSNAGEYRGYDGYRRLARGLPALWPILALTIVPGVNPVGRRIYDQVARRRSTACGSEPRPIKHAR